jgi:hypothetical protein
MQTQTAEPLAELWARFSNALPELTAGLLVVAAGIICGWLAKRAVVRMLVWLRLDRLAGRVGWRAGLSKGDVRAALYNAIGNFAMLAIVLVFLDDALGRWGLAALSRITDAVVFYLPNIVLVSLVLGVGIALSNGISAKVTDALEEEGVPRATLAGKAVKAGMLSVVTALALWQLHFAREIVLAAFLITFGSVGVAFALGAGLGSARALERGLGQVFVKKRDDA